jgi:hypothetical protein
MKTLLLILFYPLISLSDDQIIKYLNQHSMKWKSKRLMTKNLGDLLNERCTSDLLKTIDPELMITVNNKILNKSYISGVSKNINFVLEWRFFTVKNKGNIALTNMVEIKNFKELTGKIPFAKYKLLNAIFHMIYQFSDNDQGSTLNVVALSDKNRGLVDAKNWADMGFEFKNEQSRLITLTSLFKLYQARFQKGNLFKLTNSVKYPYEMLSHPETANFLETGALWNGTFHPRKIYPKNLKLGIKYFYNEYQKLGLRPTLSCQ